MIFSGLRQWLLALSLFLFVDHGFPAQAQTPPPGWSKQDMDRFVDAVGDAVARKLAEQGKAAPARPPVPAHAEEPAFVSILTARMGEIGANMPGAIRHGWSLPELLDQSAKGGLGFWSFLFSVAFTAAAGLGAEWAVRLLTRRMVAHLTEDVTPPIHWLRWLALAAIEALAIVAFYVVGHAFYAPLFHSGGVQDRIAATLLFSLFSWRVAISIMRCWLRPQLPVARLAQLDDRDSAAILRTFALATAVPILSRAYVGILTMTGAGRDEIVAQQFINAPVVIGSFIIGVLAIKGPFGRWLQTLVANHRGPNHWFRGLLANWHIGGVAFYVLLWLAQSYGGISGRVDVPAALNLVQQLLIGWLLVETAIDAVYDRRFAVGEDKAPRAPELLDIAWRAVHILVRLGVLIALVRLVLTEVLGVIPQSAWAGYSATMVSVGLVLFAAWALWQVTKFYFELVAGPERGPAMPGEEEAEDDAEKIEGASRLRTLMPLMKTLIATAIFGVTILIVLSQLGVNITPLIAGASIFGLALSFGSQALVRDIVSGIFYLADDAFRVGEYIDIGKAKGTVESFTLRSIRLRHQGGQVHTIPFGQLGQITNFSRDWATVKFNLRFARETDIEALRKAAKKIGQELMEDPDLKDDFILPLKMQGIADIQDNALIARFKFTVRPGRPSYIQRTAVKRMLQTFPEKGIEFASAMVAVKSVDGTSASAGAAAMTAATRNAAAQPAT